MAPLTPAAAAAISANTPLLYRPAGQQRLDLLDGGCPCAGLGDRDGGGEVSESGGGDSVALSDGQCQRQACFERVACAADVYGLIVAQRGNQARLFALKKQSAIGAARDVKGLPRAEVAPKNRAGGFRAVVFRLGLDTARGFTGFIF